MDRARMAAAACFLGLLLFSNIVPASFAVSPPQCLLHACPTETTLASPHPLGPAPALNVILSIRPTTLFPGGPYVLLGHVTTAAGRAIPGLPGLVIAVTGPQKVKTDLAGNFRLQMPGLPPGTWTDTAIFPGVQSSITITVIQPPPPHDDKCTIAVVKPIFTATAYSEDQPGATWHDFYDFYAKYDFSPTPIRPPNPDLNWLSLNISLGLRWNDGWAGAYGLYQFLSSDSARANGLVMGQNVCVITDLDLNNGVLFRANGTIAYRTIIMGHEEYVTTRMVNDVQRFVGAGGKLVAMSGNPFYVIVDFDRKTSIVSLVIGHGWAHNSSGAFHGPNTVLWRKTLDFMGTVSGFYPTTIDHTGALLNLSNPIGRALYNSFNSPIVFKAYSFYSDNDYVENFTRTSMVAVFLDASGNPLCVQAPPTGHRSCLGAFIHYYGHGMTIGTSVLSDKNIGTDREFQKFLLAAIALR